MPAGQLVVAHYERLLAAAPWLDVSLSWTVVQPLDGPMDLEEVAELIGGPGTGLREREVEGFDGGRLRLFMAALDPGQVAGADPPALDHVFRLLPEPAAPLSHAGAMAVVQLDSGAHLDADWLESPQYALVFAEEA
ncbi:hypothetical protein HII36_41640 [Nonomuraea sp. NN258]|uniref:hypothetical protein n=1 Tax=Nonomuraea antri TaxID=2730852 RepID=UPI001568CCD5|nr:hypothetical protein [Nonomuraea antri]NRQ38286.1 hypothetical protein [Nonomuraea antri]